MNVIKNIFRETIFISSILLGICRRAFCFLHSRRLLRVYKEGNEKFRDTVILLYIYIVDTEVCLQQSIEISSKFSLSTPCYHDSGVKNLYAWTAFIVGLIAIFHMRVKSKLNDAFFFLKSSSMRNNWLFVDNFRII